MAKQTVCYLIHSHIAVLEPILDHRHHARAQRPVVCYRLPKILRRLLLSFRHVASDVRVQHIAVLSNKLDVHIRFPQAQNRRVVLVYLPLFLSFPRHLIEPLCPSCRPSSRYQAIFHISQRIRLTFWSRKPVATTCRHSLSSFPSRILHARLRAPVLLIALDQLRQLLVLNYVHSISSNVLCDKR